MKKEEKEEKGVKKGKKKHRKLKFFLLIVLAIILIIVGIVTYKTIKNGGGMQGFLSTMVGQDKEKLKDMPKFEVLVLGESQNLTDTIMVCSYDPKTQQASMLSIPRDTFVGKNKNKATAWDKINSVYQKKNSDKILKAVNDILEMDIKYYVTVDTKALIQLVDAIGGVEFDVPIDMLYDDTTQDLHINLKAGEQKLKGQEAEWLVRFRHNNNGTSYPEEYGNNDIGRMRTQREFITAVLNQTLKPQNILKIGQILDIAKQNVRTNIDFDVIKDYIPYAVNFSVENLKTGTLPGEPEKCNGAWLYIHNKVETAKIKQELFDIPVEVQNTENQNTINNNISTKTKSEEQSEEIKIELLNGTGNTNNLSKVTKLLKEKGYNVVKTGNANSKTKTSIVNRTNKSSIIANELKKIIKVGVITEESDNSKVDFTITLGKDYK